MAAAFLLLVFAGQVVAQSYGNGACSFIPNSQRCVDATPCKTLTDGNTACLAGAPLPAGAVTVPQSCWQYSYDYACATQNTTDTCAPYEGNRACSVTMSQCADTIPETGACDQWLYTYKCLTKPATTTQQTVCSSGLFSSAAFPTPANTNNSFGRAAVAQELMREAQVYNTGTGIFGGKQESCEKGYFGIKNCCSAAPGAKNNSQLLSTAMGAAATVAKYVGEKAVDMGSQWVYDGMYDNMFSQGLTANLVEGSGTLGGIAGTGSLSVGAFGFSIGAGTMPAGLFDANIAIYAGEDFYLAFNPYMFAISMVIMIIQQLGQCSQDEQLLAIHKGANLSYHVKTECASKVLGSCVLWRQTYCSFNSVLAKIVNIQGKQQLGMDIENCQGLAIEDLNKLDFSRIDFTEFTQQIVNAANSALPTNISGNYQPAMQATPHGSAQGASAVTPSYQQ